MCASWGDIGERLMEFTSIFSIHAQNPPSVSIQAFPVYRPPSKFDRTVSEYWLNTRVWSEVYIIYGHNTPQHETRGGWPVSGWVGVWLVSYLDDRPVDTLAWMKLTAVCPITYLHTVPLTPTGGQPLVNSPRQRDNRCIGARASQPDEFWELDCHDLCNLICLFSAQTRIKRNTWRWSSWLILYSQKNWPPRAARGQAARSQDNLKVCKWFCLWWVSIRLDLTILLVLWPDRPGCEGVLYTDWSIRAICGIPHSGRSGHRDETRILLQSATRRNSPWT